MGHTRWYTTRSLVEHNRSHANTNGSSPIVMFPFMFAREGNGEGDAASEGEHEHGNT